MLPFGLVVVSLGAASGALVGAFEYPNLMFNRCQLICSLDGDNRLIETVVLLAFRGHVRGGWSVMTPRLNVYALALVAAVVDSLSSTELLKA